MKKKFITAILAVSCLGLSVGSASAAITCNGVSVAGIGTTANAAVTSGLVVQLKNVSGVTCGGTWAPNAILQLALNSNAQTDATYATLLTALSLQKTLFVQAGAATANSLLLIATIKN